MMSVAGVALGLIPGPTTEKKETRNFAENTLSFWKKRSGGMKGFIGKIRIWR